MNKKNIFLILLLTIISIVGSLAQGNKKYKKHKGPKVKHHAGFFSSNDKATRKNEKFKKKNSKAGNSKKTSSKTKSKSKAVSRTRYVKTFDHH